jgi:hypothetical protein
VAFYLTNGLIAGMILATFLALCDGLFQTTTFQVLIDVSYVPGLDNLPSIVELLIHLLISVFVTFVMISFYPRYRSAGAMKYLLLWLAAFSILYVPVSMLSGYPLAFGAFIIWVIGHLLFTLFVAFQVERYR